jgi:hypothetical protein
LQCLERAFVYDCGMNSETLDIDETTYQV